MASLMESVNGLKSQLAAKETTMAGLQQELEDHETAGEEQAKEIARLTDAAAGLQQQLESLQQDLKTQLRNHTSNYDMLSEDYEYIVGEHGKVSEQLTSRQADLDAALKERVSLDQVVADLRAELKTMQEDFDTRLANVKSQKAAGDDDLMVVVQSQEEELAQLKNSESQYIRLLAELEEKQKDRRVEVESLKVCEHSLL